jgi:hypothetical protein
MHTIITTMVAAAIVFGTVTPAHADGQRTTIGSADPHTITITNHTPDVLEYRVQIYDAAMTFPLDSGASRTFRSVPTLEDRVYWALWYADGEFIGSGDMTPVEGGDPRGGEQQGFDHGRTPFPEGWADDLGRIAPKASVRSCSLGGDSARRATF